MELINDAKHLRTLGSYLNKQSKGWSSMSGELLADTRRLGQTWTDSQFRDLSASIAHLNTQLVAFQDKAKRWSDLLDKKADKLDAYYKLQQER